MEEKKKKSKSIYSSFFAKLHDIPWRSCISNVWQPSTSPGIWNSFVDHQTLPESIIRGITRFGFHENFCGFWPWKSCREKVGEINLEADDFAASHAHTIDSKGQIFDRASRRTWLEKTRNNFVAAHFSQDVFHGMLWFPNTCNTRLVFSRSFSHILYLFSWNGNALKYYICIILKRALICCDCGIIVTENWKLNNLKFYSDFYSLLCKLQTILWNRFTNLRQHWLSFNKVSTLRLY